MITIQTIAGEKFDLQVDLRLAIEETSVFDGKEGSYSLPLELPYTNRNAQVLGMPSNIARIQKFTTNVDVIVSSGAWVRHAKLEVNESVYKENIQCTLFLRESPFYSKIENLQLSDVFSEKVVDLFPHVSTLSSKMVLLIQHLEKVARGEVDTDFFIFPVCAAVNEFELTENDINVPGGIKVTKSWKRFKIMNKQITPDATLETGITDTYQGAPYYILAGSQYEYTESGVSYRLPTGYGISPFLKFTYILRQVFAFLGYTLEASIFDTDVSFQKMCLLNNTMDAVVSGIIDYSQLVPDVSVVEFLEFVENSFGCEFVIDEMFKTATPRFWNDLLTEAPSGNLSNKFEDFPQMLYHTPEGVKLTIDRANKESTPINFETFGELFQKYGAPTYRANYKDTVAQLVRDGIQDGDFFYYFADQFRYMLFTDGYFGPRYVVEKDTLDYFDPMDKVTLREIDTHIESVPMKEIATGGVTGVRADFEVSIIFFSKKSNDLIAQSLSKEYTTEDRLVAKMPFIDSYRHLNTVEQKKQIKDNKEIISEEEESSVDLPILPCFHYGLAKPDVDMPHIEKTFFGTTHRYDNRGNAWGTFDLTTKSLYERFWQKYDKVLRTSYHTINGSAQLSIGEVMQLDFDKQYLLDNQRVLPTSIQYEVTDEGVEVTNLTVKTTKVYE